MAQGMLIAQVYTCRVESLLAIQIDRQDQGRVRRSSEFCGERNRIFQ